MNQGHTVTTEPGDQHVEVRIDGTVLADSQRPVLLEETGLPTRYYLPRQDVRMELLERSSTHTRCPFKGEASYWSLDREGGEDIVWSYEDPLPAAQGIKDMLCFYPERVEMILDGRTVTT